MSSPPSTPGSWPPGGAGEDIIDLGFGNPDIPSPEIAVDKLCEAAHVGRNHRLPRQPRHSQAPARHLHLYRPQVGVDIDPETEAINTIAPRKACPT